MDVILSLIVLSFTILPAWSNVEEIERDFEANVVFHSFTDKTMMLLHLFDGPRLKLITAPPHFGKTRNFGMIKSFLSIKTSKNGTVKIRNTTVTHKVFTKRYIFNHSEFFNTHFAQYPVLLIILRAGKNDLKGKNEAVEMFRCQVRRAFTEHKYLINSSMLNDEQRNTCKLWYDKNSYTQFNHSDVENGFRTLIEYMYIHFNKKVILLVDEYDAVIMKAMYATYPVQLNDIVKFVTGQVSALCEDAHISHVFVTGMLSTKGLGLDNFKEYRFLDDHPLLDYYGFTESEVKRLFNDSRFMLPSLNNTKAFVWYDGYLTKSGRKVYNPTSIICYTEIGVIANYWSEYLNLTQNLTIIFKNLKHMEILGKLLSFDAVKINHSKHRTLNDLEEIRSVYVKQDAKVNSDLIFSHLFDYGFFSYVPGQKDGAVAEIKLPNLEIEDAIIGEMAKYYQRRNQSYLNETANKIAEGARSSFVKNKIDGETNPIYFSFVNFIFQKFNITFI